MITVKQYERYISAKNFKNVKFLQIKYEGVFVGYIPDDAIVDIEENIISLYYTDPPKSDIIMNYSGYLKIKKIEAVHRELYAIKVVKNVYDSTWNKLHELAWDKQATTYNNLKYKVNNTRTGKTILTYTKNNNLVAKNKNNKILNIEKLNNREKQIIEKVGIYGTN